MIEDKNSLIADAEQELELAKTIVKENSELFDECIEYHNIWESGKKGREADLYISKNYVGVNLNICLNKDDSMADVNLFLDEIPYEIKATDEYPGGKWVKYVFYTSRGEFHLLAHYHKSKHCKLVETGETKPVYKRVCV